MKDKDAKQVSAGFKFMLDFGPLLIFFLVNSFAPGDDVQQAMWATAAFMAATATSMIFSRVKTGAISPMLWLTGALVAIFGGLTIYLHDETFIQVKPTVIYVMFSAILFFGLWTGRPLLKVVLESGFPTMDAEGWRKLTRNWAVFFLGMAVLNEAARAALDFDQWVTFKVWVVLALSMLFAVLQAPILLKHSAEHRDPPPPPPQG